MNHWRQATFAFPLAVLLDFDLDLDISTPFASRSRTSGTGACGVEGFSFASR
jgi:hypothetical protein